MPIRRVYFYLVLAILIIAAGLGLRFITDKQMAANNATPGVVATVVTKGDSGSTGTADIGGPYILINQDGVEVSEKTFAGKYPLYFFGYTFCPDVCPTTLTTFSTVMDLLGKDAAKVQPIFVTVDPERDTPEHLKSYITHFHKDLVGLTGSVAQIDHIKKVYRIYSAKTQQDKNDPEDYLVDHSSISYLMGPDGAFLTFFTYGLEAEAIALKIKGIMN